MSSAHYLHDHHGNLDTKDFTEDNEECHKSRTKGSDTDFNYTTKELKAILKEFEMDSEGGPANMKVSLNSIPINTLTAMAENRGINLVFDISKAKGKRAVQKMKKSQAQKQVFDHIAFFTESDDKNNAEKIKEETRCWNKGNWLCNLYATNC